jgi:hypothetical protein
MKSFRTLICVLVAMMVASCGGGGGAAGTPPFGNGGEQPPPGPVLPTAADLLVDASAAQLPNTSAATVTVDVTALDASRVIVAGAAVSLSADNDGVIFQSARTTNAQGKVTGTLSIGGNRSNRVITVTATSGTVVKTVAVQVVGTKVTSTLVPAVLAPGASGEVQYRVIDQAGNPMANQAVSVSAPGLNPATATGTTGANGDYKFNYTAPATGGAYRIAMTAAGVTDEQVVNVQAVASVPPVTVPIRSSSVSANPSVVGVNAAGSTANRAEIRALFLTDNNVPVPNVRVRFDLGGDPNRIGGSFSSGTTTLYSDVNGIVTTAYLPGIRSSPTDGVVVRACYGVSDTDPNLLNCTTNATVRLTVTQEPLGVSIGTNELIVVGELTYTKRFLISVADSAGNAKSDVALSVSLDLPQYRKGLYFLDGDRWRKVGPPPDADRAVCNAEDVNRNGVLEAGEDINGNARLDPGRSDVTVRLLQSTTRADGTAVGEITYAKSFATWVDAWITVAASGVSGTEGRATYVFDPIPADAAALRNKDVTPAFAVSPWGIGPNCTDTN